MKLKITIQTKINKIWLTKKGMVMKKKKYRWGIVADLVRTLSNVSNDGLNLNDIETEYALQDLATIMDTMMINNCGFEKFLNIERSNDEEFALWVEEALEVIN